MYRGRSQLQTMFATGSLQLTDFGEITRQSGHSFNIQFHTLNTSNETLKNQNQNQNQTHVYCHVSFTLTISFGVVGAR